MRTQPESIKRLSIRRCTGALVLAACALSAHGAAVLLRAPAVVAAYHLGYGLGSVLGWIDVLRGVTAAQARNSRFARLTR